MADRPDPAEAHDAELAIKVAELEQALAPPDGRCQAAHPGAPAPAARSNTFAFRVADCEGYVTVGRVRGRPPRRGVHEGLQAGLDPGRDHGRLRHLRQPRPPARVPLATYVKKYTNMRFEPAGMTDDPDLRIAQSLVDYIFRRWPSTTCPTRSGRAGRAHLRRADPADLAGRRGGGDTQFACGRGRAEP
jgi:ribonucleoside-diphosphate reductase alpha chain